MMVATCGTAKNRTVRVEGCGGDRGAAVLLQEVGVWLQSRQFLAIEVENLNGMGRGATATRSVHMLTTIITVEMSSRSRTYTEKTGKCSCTLAVRKVSLVVWKACSGLSILISHSLTLPFLLALSNSLWPPRCM
jgi:hypothetical protein